MEKTPVKKPEKQEQEERTIVGNSRTGSCLTAENDETFCLHLTIDSLTVYDSVSS